MNQKKLHNLKTRKKRVLILSSGAGSTYEYLLKTTSEFWQVCGLISNKADSGCVNISRLSGGSYVVCDPKDYPSYERWDKDLAILAADFEADLIVLAGFLKRIGPEFLKAFADKVINTHPSLLPQYGGHGMYGRKVHQAVLDNKESSTGVTIHWVNEKYDSGEVIGQIQVDVQPEDTIDTLESKVKQAEKIFLVETLNRICRE